MRKLTDLPTKQMRAIKQLIASFDLRGIETVESGLAISRWSEQDVTQIRMAINKRRAQLRKSGNPARRTPSQLREAS